MISDRDKNILNAPPSHIQRNDCATNGVLFSNEEWASLSDSLKLCPRELQVVQGIITDLTEQQIAIRLGISYHTIHTYLISVYRKLYVSSRCELVVAVFTEFRRQQDVP